ncbi:MAG: sugar O-acetyltransferase [Anaerovoracaceae bacterium]|jgi:maltose O-acetyltransferase
MNVFDKARAGMLFNAGSDPDVLSAYEHAMDLCHEYNQCRPSDAERRGSILRELFRSIGKNYEIRSPFYCDVGFNITIGNDFFSNYNLIILDQAQVSIGNRVIIAPNCTMITPTHPIDKDWRAAGVECARPIRIENDVWIGANVTIFPGVTIGSGSVIGAGSLVNRDIPPNVIAIGTPCRVLREITREDREKYSEEEIREALRPEKY